MSRFRAALATAATAAALLVAPASATPPNGFVLAGSTSGWVDLDVRGIGHSIGLSSARVETAGRFGGFFAEQLESSYDEQFTGATAGRLVVRDLSIGPGNAASIGSAHDLTTGRIRFYLIADGPTTVRFDFSSQLPKVSVKPKHRTAASYALLPLTRSGDAWWRNARVTLPRRAVAFVGMRARGDALLASDPDLCLANATPDCPDDPRHELLERPGHATGTAAPADEVRVWWEAYRSGGPILPGKRHVRYAITPASGALPVREARGASFVLTLV